jgi:hypothetical protein
MVDIESTGLLPDRSAILQISAVKFNLKEKTVCPDFFKESLSIPQHRHWDQGTLSWWVKDKAPLLKDIMSRAKPHRQVINQFADYSYQNPGFRFWSKPTHFDFMFLASYFHDEHLVNPFHYRVARDLNTYLEALFYPHAVPETELAAIPFDGPAHDSLFDALHQLKVLFKAVELSGR